MKIAGGKLKPSSFQQKKIKKIGPSGVKLRACKCQHSKTKFTASYGLLGSNGLRNFLFFLFFDYLGNRSTYFKNSKSSEFVVL